MAFGSRALNPNASFEPFWWRAAPHEQKGLQAPPSRNGMAIVGSGITGLVAAIHLARGGRQVTVFEAQEPGHGASTRNAGYLGRTLKHDLGEIAAHEVVLPRQRVVCAACDPVVEPGGQVAERRVRGR